jgi:hypothetical protein
MSNLRVVLHQIYVNLYVEYGMLDWKSFYITRKKANGMTIVTKNPLSRMLLNLNIKGNYSNRNIAVEHPGGEGVAVELFELGLDRFVVRIFPRFSIQS